MDMSYHCIVQHDTVTHISSLHCERSVYSTAQGYTTASYWYDWRRGISI